MRAYCPMIRIQLDDITRDELRRLRPVPTMEAEAKHRNPAFPRRSAGTRSGEQRVENEGVKTYSDSSRCRQGKTADGTTFQAHHHGSRV